MIWVILFTISLIINILLLWGLKNLFKKQDIYEENYIDTKIKLEILYRELKDIDDRGIFEKDDDVGSTFEGIKSLIEKYNDEI
jgi:hypothetical protein